MKEAPKVLHIITRLDFGGSALNTITIIDRLRNYNFQTALAFGLTNDPEGSMRAILASSNIPRFYLPCLVRNPSPLQDLRALNAIMRLLKNGKFDLIHTHTSKAGTLGRLAAHWRGIPAVHMPHGHVFYGYFGPLLTSFFVLIERWMAHWTARIISLSDDETRESLERGIGRPEQYVTIPTGVRLSLFKDIPREKGACLRNTLKIPLDAFVFVSIGRLVRIKGFDILIKAFTRADFSARGGKGRKVFLVIVGDGEERKNLEALAWQLGVSSRVRFAGAMRDIRAALSAADAFVLASRNEGMGNVFIEAMASGLPVIGTAVGGVPSVIHDRQTGLLVKGEDPEAMARALTEMAVNDDGRKAFARNAGASISPEQDEEATASRIAALYYEVLSLKG